MDEIAKALPDVFSWREVISILKILPQDDVVNPWTEGAGMKHRSLTIRHFALSGKLDMTLTRTKRAEVESLLVRYLSPGTLMKPKQGALSPKQKQVFEETQQMAEDMLRHAYKHSGLSLDVFTACHKVTR